MSPELLLSLHENYERHGDVLEWRDFVGNTTGPVIFTDMVAAYLCLSHGVAMDELEFSGHGAAFRSPDLLLLGVDAFGSEDAVNVQHHFGATQYVGAFARRWDYLMPGHQFEKVRKRGAYF